MNENKTSSPSFVHVGSSSLLVVFLVLALVTFAVLSLSTAQSDLSFSRKLADRKSAYYEASNRAEEILSQIDALMDETYRTSSGQTSSYLDLLQTGLSTSEFTVPVTLDSRAEGKTNPNEIICFTVPITEDQALSVALKINTAVREGDSYYSILSWKTISTSDWNGDDKAHLVR